MSLLMFACTLFLTVGLQTSLGYTYSHASEHYDGYLSDWNSEWDLSGRLNQPKCINIPQNLTLCQDIGYNQMRLPNLLEHDSIREVTQQAKSWVPLTNIRCHPDTKLFLCSLFSPVCLDRPIWPCRTLCNAVKTGCEALMTKYGYPWPDMLQCDKFPLDNDLCIGLQNHADNKEKKEELPDETKCAACNKPNTIEGIVDNFCSSDFVIRIKVEENVISDGFIKLTAQSKKKVYKKGNLKKRDLKKVVVYINNGATCECAALDGVNFRKQSFFVMGKKEGDKMMVNYIVPYDTKSKEMKKVVRSMRKEDKICKAGLKILTESGKEKKKPKRKNEDRQAKKNKRENARRRIRNNRRQIETSNVFL